MLSELPISRRELLRMGAAGTAWLAAGRLGLSALAAAAQTTSTCPATSQSSREKKMGFPVIPSYPVRFPGPHADLPDGYSAALGGILDHGHLMTRQTAYLARTILLDAKSSTQRRGEAFACLETVIRSQITQAAPGALLDPRGCWMWSVDDTTKTGVSFNWEDFIGAALLEILYLDAVPGHADWPSGLEGRLKTCVANAVRCSMNRHVRISYTNPVAMSIECAGLAGQLLGEAEFTRHARERLAEWRQFTEHAGTFEEYNSNTYGGITLPHIASFVEHIRDEQLRQAGLYMERLYFDHVCDFFHRPTLEMSMPRSREYNDRFSTSLLYEYLYRILQQRRPGVLPWPEKRRESDTFSVAYSHATDEQIDKLLRTFETPVRTSLFCEWIGVDHVGPLDQIPPVSTVQPPQRRRELTCYRSAEFSLGSVNEMDSWNQRRALGGYLRTAAGSAMIAWKPLFVIPGSDDNDLVHQWPIMMYFNLCSGQDGPTVLAGITAMPVSEGWLAGSHWRQRVRGGVPDLSVDLGFDLDLPDRQGELDRPETGKLWQCIAGESVIRLLPLGGQLAGQAARPELRRTGEHQWRLSLLRVEHLPFDWSSPPPVQLAFVLDVQPSGGPEGMLEGRSEGSGSRLIAWASAGRRRLHLRYDPPDIRALTRQACTFEVKGV